VANLEIMITIEIKMIYLINIILFAVVIYFVYKNYTLTKKKVIEQIDKDWLRLPIPKYETPKWEDFDPDHTLLKDVLESIKLEDWTSKIEQERNYGISERRSYTIELYNPSNTLKVRSRLYVYDNKANLASFNIIKTIPGTAFTNGSASYNTDNTETSTLILSQLWGFILEHHEKIYSETIVGYERVRESIDTELKTLKRDNALKSLLG
jgi:hypothetical protein